jgi:hypothetical protein
MISINSHAPKDTFHVRQLLGLEFRRNHNVHLPSKTPRIQSTVGPEVDAFAVINSRTNYLDLVNVTACHSDHASKQDFVAI